jgi:2-polyprenyl-6-methoxyphenol hydroxylase-like FAD-dependent oxidoreductase
LQNLSHFFLMLFLFRVRLSPAGGVGINLALQDALATANLLAEKLKKGPVCLADLEQVQKRRE